MSDFYKIIPDNNESNYVFISLDQYTRTPQEKYKKQYCQEALNDIVTKSQNKHVYQLPQSKLKEIKSYPFILYKNFNKSSSYMSNFSEAIFANTSFISTKFKICSFYGATFDSCLLQGSLFRKCNLTNVIFENTIILSSIFDKTKLKNCKFNNCRILHGKKLKTLIPEKNLVNTLFLENFPDIKNFNANLIQVIENLRINDYIRRSGTFHRKKGSLNTISIDILLSHFDELFLIENLPKLLNLITREFHTLSYIQKLLYKIKNGIL